MAETFTSRVELTLKDAVNLALNSVKMRENNILHNLFFIVDKPGAGKTMCIGSEVEKRGWGFCPYSPALERLEKFGGIPDLFWTGKKAHEGELRTVWSVPQMISEINDAANKFPFVVVLFDDWHLCDEDLQRIGFEVFTYYKLNNNPVAQNVIFMLAGNESSAAGAKIQMSAIRNRTTILHCKADVKQWLSDFAIPSGINPLGISFFSNPINFDIFQEDESTIDQFGSPRSWTSLFNIINFIEQDKSLWTKDINGDFELPRSFIYAVVQGSVSRSAAERFMMHYDIYKEVNMEKFFEEEVIEIPKDPVGRYCYTTAITYEFYSRYVQEKDAEKQKSIGELFIKFINLLKNTHKELAMTSLVNLGHIPENTQHNYQSGIMLLGELVRDKTIDSKLLDELKSITRILSSVN